MIDDDAVAVNPEPARMQHLAAVGRDERRGRRRGEIEAEMDLLIDLVASIHVGAVVGEARFDLRAAHRHERPFPEARRIGAFRDRDDPLGVGAPQVAVDLEKGREEVGAPRVDAELGRLRQDVGDDPLQEAIVERDAALAERFRKDAVDEPDARLVARFVAREDRHRRLQVVVVREREERDLERRVCAGHPRAGRRIAGKFR